MRRHLGTQRPRDRQWAKIALLVVILTWLVGCAESSASTQIAIPDPTPLRESRELASVVSVDVSGGPNTYAFTVGVSSPDSGCEQYANWWEVISEEGTLIYRRILLHSHTGEQPFERSGSPVAVSANEIVVVRAHMHPGGYGGSAMRGSVEEGFATMPGDPAFAAGLEESAPLPDGCAF